jgi:hypothetical protein
VEASAPAAAGRAAPAAGVRGAPGAAPPVLRVWPLDRLALHEEADAGRVRRLAEALTRDGVLRNPPVVAPMSDGRAVVLDGANRVSALRALGLPHAVVQSVQYDDTDIILDAWRHYVPANRTGALRAAAAAAVWARTIAAGGEAEAVDRVGRGGAVAAIVDAEGGVLVLPAGDGDPAGALRRLAALYHDGRSVYRVAGAAGSDLRAAYGPGALVLFRRFGKAELLALAAAGHLLPAGITRHVIPGRALRLNTPLAWLADPAGAAAKQAALDAQVRRRWERHSVRYYAEATFAFDE